jgi:carbamoyltransferase
MGLAAYGDSSVYYDKVSALMKRDGDGIMCDMKSFNWNRSSKMMFDPQLEETIGISCRMPDDPLTKDHMDVAAAVQRVYEEVVFSLINDNIKYSDRGNLCLGGGCAYNGTANGKMKDMTTCNKLWVPLAPSDAGSCIGACIDYISNVLDKKPVIPSSPFLGPEYSKKEILHALNSSKLIRFEEYNKYEMHELIAGLIKSGKIIGMFRGRIEFGARALGNRSILASPSFPDMKDRINRVIKKREGFRPFAPMVTYESQSRFFESDDYVPYMNQVVKVKPEWREAFPSITHIDGTARVQSVLADNEIYDLLKHMENDHSYPILLNTSFNVKDKTMVLTPLDALETFLDTEMDVLIIENYLVTKI